ncbi:hypothetical protein H6F67_00040 [Microcoleus sp. FACHB-1515]|uniref:hypothetical protein n=1 Tax=Cyanophyceae TaxID=3028117 RepID=UPI001689F267|nr:hypothetical protein [Microcoleus sp. FACHB-1515]MBD2088265.1 hypothetical protein [Microcoleus sp. FACHB-1515]
MFTLVQMLGNLGRPPSTGIASHCHGSQFDPTSNPIGQTQLVQGAVFFGIELNVMCGRHKRTR